MRKRYTVIFTDAHVYDVALCDNTLRNVALGRAGLTIGQTGQMPGASRLNIKTLLYWFFIFLACSPRVKIVELFDYCVCYIGQGN